MNKIRVKVDFGYQSGLGYTSLEHEYDVPYERDDKFILRSSEEDPFSPSNKYEPEVGKSLYADVNYEYNYFINNYELKTKGIDENLLPNLNYYLLHKEGYISDSLYDDLFYFGGGQRTSPNQKSFLSNRYFDEYADMLRRIEGQYIESIVQNNNLTKEYISKEAIQVYSDIDNKREMFPYYTKIHMTGMPLSPFAELVEKAGLGKIFVDFLIMHRESELNNVHTGAIAGVSVDPPIDSRIKVYNGCL